MERQNVFENSREVDRLAVQNQLLWECEAPVFQHLLTGKKGLRVLDVGCNNGLKTAERFNRPEIDRVVGLEYNDKLVRQAQEQHGDERFSFYSCDLESKTFSEDMKAVMEREGIDGFDLIYISFVLMHLKHPETMLKKLRPLLAAGGRLLVEEVDDMACSLRPDKGDLFQTFLNMLSQDPYAGNRRCGEQVAGWLERCGYQEVQQLPASMRASNGQLKKKENLFEIFFSYLPQDMAELCQREPDNEVWASCCKWLGQNYDKLHREVMEGKSELTVSMRVVLCAGV